MVSTFQFIWSVRPWGVHAFYVVQIASEELDLLFHLHQVLELLLTQQEMLPGIFNRIRSTLMQPLALNVMSWTLLLGKVKEIVCNTTLVAYNLELVEVEVLSQISLMNSQSCTIGCDASSNFPLFFRILFWVKSRWLCKFPYLWYIFFFKFDSFHIERDVFVMPWSFMHAFCTRHFIV